MSIDPKASKIFKVMIERGLIPTHGVFEVTDELREHSHNIFREVFPPKSNTYRQAEKKFALKLAGLNMMRLNEQRFGEIQETSKQRKVQQNCGFVYVISNPAFPGMFKVGMTKDINGRLRTYQTADPYRRFRVEHYIFVQNRREIEKQILEDMKLNLVQGEWVRAASAKEVFEGRI